MSCQPRGSEATLQDFLQWDVHNWSVALDVWLAGTMQSLSGTRVLEVGGGSGGLSLWLALQGARVCCSDVAAPTREAVRLHQAFAVSHRIEYRQIDATNVPYENEFDIVLFKSVLGGVGFRYGKEGQARAVAQMHKALRKGGELFFAENLTGAALHRFFRRRFVEWGRTWRYVSMEEMLEFLEPFSVTTCRSFGFAGAFGRSEWQRKALGLLDTGLLNRLTPAGWRYIVVGVARK